MATTNGNKNDWVTLLQEARRNGADRIPPGYMTKAEVMDKFGISRDQFVRQMPIMLEAGKFTVGFYRRVDSAGRLIKMKHFKKK